MRRTTGPTVGVPAGPAADAPFAEGVLHVHTPLCASPDRVVVGVDRSAEAVAALRWAGQEARLRRTHLHVVHAWEPPGRQAEAERLVRDLLAQAFARLPTGVESLAVRSHAAEALVAAGHGAALLVIGSHPRGVFSEVFTSVTRRTAAFATCPVAAVRQGQDGPPRFGTVLVGIDDSFTSRDALRWAAIEALHRDALLKVVPATPAPAPGVLVRPWRTAHEAGEMAGDLLAAALTGPLAAVRVTVEAVPGEAGEASGQARSPGTGTIHRAGDRAGLLTASQTADVLVIGSHGYGSLSGALAGSVTSDALHGAACPVVVIPATREDERLRAREALQAMEAGSPESGGAVLYPEGGTEAGHTQGPQK